MTEVGEWSATEQAVADVIAEEAGLPYMARIRDFWDEGRSREENIEALQLADRQADAANLAFVRKLIAAAQPEVERLRGLLKRLEWADHKTRGGFDTGSPMRILQCCPACQATAGFPHRDCWLAAEISEDASRSQPEG